MEDMFNDSSAVERVRRGGSHSSNTAKLVNMDVWYATTLWLALLSGWIDPSSGRRTRKNPTGGILMKPIMPPALLTPQTLDDSYYYDQGGPPIPHPAIPSNYPIPGPEFDSIPQNNRLWRSIEGQHKQTRAMAMDNSNRPFPGLQRSLQTRSSNNPFLHFPPNPQFHSNIRGMGPPKKAALSRMDSIKDLLSEESPSFGQNVNPFNRDPPFSNQNPFMADSQLNKKNSLNERDQMSDSPFGQSLEWSGRQRRQPNRLPSPASMENLWDPMSRYGSMRSRQLSPMLGLEDKQGQNMMNHFDESDSQSEEHPPAPSLLPRQRKGLAQQRAMMRSPQSMPNFPYPGPMNSQRLQQRKLLPMSPQYNQDTQDYSENGHSRSSKNVNRSSKQRNGKKQTSSHSRVANVEELQGDENLGSEGLLKTPNVEKQIKSEKLVQQQDDEFVVESEERLNVTTGKPLEQLKDKETKSVEGSDESKNTEDSGSSEEVTTKRASTHKSKSQHGHKEHKEHKEAVAVQTEAEENVTKHSHGRTHHSSRSKVKSNESGEEDKEHGSPKKRRPRTTLATDFNVEDSDKKEVVGDTLAVEPKKN